MKICLYSPYVPKHLGGGEKYFFDVASLLAEEHTVTVTVPSSYSQDELKAAQKKYEQFLNRSLDAISFRYSPLHGGSLMQKLHWTRGFDACFAVTDGSLFFSAAKRNVLHIQVPFTEPKVGMIERQKLRNWAVKNANSAFTCDVVERAWQTKIQYLHYPAIDDHCFQHIGKKERVILNVGRFFRQLHSKRQDILVRAFAQLRESSPELTQNWKLVYVGTVEDQEYFSEVKQLAKGQPVEFYQHLDRAEVLQWYQRASIYWHATGFEVDEAVHPERVEHFGISTAEAMASGCIPVVVGKGGQREVLGEKPQHLQWYSIDECVEHTKKLLENPSTWPTLQELSVSQAKQFSSARFRELLYEMITL